MKLVDVKDFCSAEFGEAGERVVEQNFTRLRIFAFCSSEDLFRLFRQIRETLYLFIYLFITLAASASFFFSISVIKTCLIINLAADLDSHTQSDTV